MLIRMLDGGRGLGLLALVLLLPGIFGFALHPALILSVTGRPAEAHITRVRSGMTRGRVSHRPSSSSLPQLVHSAAFTGSEAGAAPVAFQTRIKRSAWSRLEAGMTVPANRSRLWPESIASVDPEGLRPQAMGWLAMTLAGFGGLTWRAEGERGATLPLPGNCTELAKRWAVTGTLTLWRHPDGNGRL